MNFDHWNPAAISFTFNNNIPTCFGRPTKVVKPRSESRTNSPRSTGRRRMTTIGHYPARTRSVVDYERAAAPQYIQQQSHNARPTSWHPNTMDNMSSFQPFYQYSGEDFATGPQITTEVNGLITPMTYPNMNGPQIQELIAPLESLSAREATDYYYDGQDTSAADQIKPYQHHYNDGSIFPDHNYQAWYLNNLQHVNNVPTAPPSPKYILEHDYPTIRDTQRPDVQVEQEELVGMGLYDSPAEVRLSSMLFGSDAGLAKRKSLKLEDAFEPSPTSDESEDAPSEDDIGYSDHGPVAIDLTQSPDDDSAGLTDYSYLLTKPDLLGPQWSIENQAAYGWI